MWKQSYMNMRAYNAKAYNAKAYYWFPLLVVDIYAGHFLGSWRGLCSIVLTFPCSSGNIYMYRKRDFSDTNFKIGKPCWLFKWILRSSPWARLKNSVEKFQSWYQRTLFSVLCRSQLRSNQFEFICTLNVNELIQAWLLVPRSSYIHYWWQLWG